MNAVPPVCPGVCHEYSCVSAKFTSAPKNGGRMLSRYRRAAASMRPAMKSGLSSGNQMKPSMFSTKLSGTRLRSSRVIASRIGSPAVRRRIRSITRKPGARSFAQSPHDNTTQLNPASEATAVSASNREFARTTCRSLVSRRSSIKWALRASARSATISATTRTGKVRAISCGREVLLRPMIRSSSELRLPGFADRHCLRYADVPEKGDRVCIRYAEVVRVQRAKRRVRVDLG